MTDFTINRGSDLRATMNFSDATGAPVDLTGYTVAIYEPHPAIADHLSAQIIDAAAGEVTLTTQWADAMPTGRIMHFRVRVTAGEDDVSTQRFWVVVK